MGPVPVLVIPAIETLDTTELPAVNQSGLWASILPAPLTLRPVRRALLARWWRKVAFVRWPVEPDLVALHGVRLYTVDVQECVAAFTVRGCRER